MFVPALKNVTITGGWNRDAHSLVDMQLGMTVRIITFGFTVHTHSITCIVIKPNNERRSVSLLGLIYSNQLNRVGGVFINNRLFGIVNQDCIVSSGENRDARRHIFMCHNVISLQIPIGEHKVSILRNGRCRFCDSRCVINIKFGVWVTGNPFSTDIFNTNTIGTFYNLTPLSI